VNKSVLDASALLALLNAEDGSVVVQEFLPRSIVSAVNLAEVVTRLSILGMPEEEARQALNVLGLEVIPFDEDQALRVGFLSASTRPLGLSLGDRACLSLALTTHATALTADRSWKELDIGVEIKLIR
jgi:PIN domain nuclease of toxin-antitoxin system